MNRGVLEGWVRPPHTVEQWRAMGGVTIEPVEATSMVGASTTWPATANTLTGWTLITAASPHDACIIDVIIMGGAVSTQDSSILVDISTGAAGSEAGSILVDGIPVYGRSNYIHLRLPVRVAAGTRFSYRLQAATASLAPVPRVAIGFVRDIPGFPSGTSVQAVGSIDRAASTYTNISVAAGSLGTRRSVWATVGDLPAGNVIYLIPIGSQSASASQNNHAIIDWGWLDVSGLPVNTQVGGPREIWAAETIWYTTTAELWDPTIPVVPIPGGYRGGCVVAAVDHSNANLNKWMCLAVVE